MFDTIVGLLQTGFAGLPEASAGGNRTTYAIKDAVLSAFSVFVMQSPSFLAHQREMQRLKGRDNVQTLFGAHVTPSDNQIRNLLDPIHPNEVGAIFWAVYREIAAQGLLASHRGIAANLLCGVDGTRYFSSKQIHCENCTQRQQGQETVFSHSVIAPVLVAPGSAQVFCLEPEFIVPQDGAEKQDCEQNAIKRWVRRNASHFVAEKVTLLADDLHSKQPTCELCLAHNLNFIFVCLPQSHPTLYEELELLASLGGSNLGSIRMKSATSMDASGNAGATATSTKCPCAQVQMPSWSTGVKSRLCRRKPGNDSTSTSSLPIISSTTRAWSPPSTPVVPAGKPRTRAITS